MLEVASFTNSNQARLRVVYTMAIGIDRSKITDAVTESALVALDEALTRIAGGIVRFEGSGTWTDGSDEGYFGGRLERNRTYIYVMSAMPDQQLGALAEIRSVTRSIVAQHNLPVAHVHLERSLAEAFHFRAE